MARERGDRYASAAEPTDDLERFLSDQPILARRATLGQRAVSWWNRDRAVASLALAVGLLLVLIAAGLVGFAAWAERARSKAVRLSEQAREAERQRSLADRARAGRFSRHVGQRFQGLEAITEAAALGRRTGEPATFFDDLRTQAIACMALPDIRYGRPRGWKLVAGCTLRFDLDLEVFLWSTRDMRVHLDRAEDGSEVAVQDGYPGSRLSRSAAAGRSSRLGPRSAAFGCGI